MALLRADPFTFSRLKSARESLSSSVTLMVWPLVPRPLAPPGAAENLPRRAFALQQGLQQGFVSRACIVPSVLRLHQAPVIPQRC